MDLDRNETVVTSPLGGSPAPLAAASSAAMAAVFACVAFIAMPTVARSILPTQASGREAVLAALMAVAACLGYLRRLRRRKWVVGSVEPPGTAARVSPARIAAYSVLACVEALSAVSLVLGLAASVGLSPDELSWMLERSGLPGLGLCATWASAALVLERMDDTARLRPWLLSAGPLHRPVHCGIPHALRRRAGWTLACLGVLFCCGLSRHSGSLADLGLLCASVLLGTAAAGGRNSLQGAGRAGVLLPQVSAGREPQPTPKYI